MEAISAVEKLSIVNPGINFDVPQRRRTFIKNAAIPKVRSVMGSAISCKMGLMKVFTTPITTAATTAVQKSANTNPGTRYSTIRSANTLINNLPKSFIN